MTESSRFRIGSLEDLVAIELPSCFGDWAITEQGLENAKHGYFIAKHRLWAEQPGWNWELHLGAKEWCNFFDFWKAITYARQYHHEFRPVRMVGVRFLVFRRDGYRCTICGRNAQDGISLELDHIVPRAKGGSDDACNLQTLCWECNRGKRDLMM